MRRFEVMEIGQQPLPALDLADAVVVIGSGTGARIRLPAQAANDAHVRIEADRWVAIAEVTVDGTRHAAGDGGELGDGVTFELGGYRVRTMVAPPDAAASSPLRTESLARELVRGLLGAGAAPVLELERGPDASWRALRELPPPEAKLVIGRGDEAGWVILDEDLSREHAEIRRGWDGVTIRDLDSKNGTFVDGTRITEVTMLHDGARIELGNIELAFRDPAERHLRGDPAPAKRVATVAPPREPSSSVPFVIAAAIAGLAAIALVWVLAS
ncbi:MAG: FHA domain-containing protein [Kofleriaceae bacterium]